MGELFAYDHISDQPMERVQLNHRELREATLEVGDLLFARSSLKPEGVGKCSIVVAVPETTTFESHLIRARLDRNRADPRFYYYFFRSYEGRATVLSLAKQVGAAGMPGSKLAGLMVPAPDLATQQRISDFLSIFDDLIADNLRRIKLLEDSVRLVFDEWFVRLRFPGHEAVNVSAGVPSGWTRRPLCDCLVLNYGKALRSDDRNDEGSVPVYGSSGIVGHHDNALVPGPGIIVGRKGNVGSVFWCGIDFWPIDTVYFINREESDLYLFHALQRMQFISTDVAVPGLNRDFAYSRELLEPTFELRQRFLDLAVPAQQQIDTLTAANGKLRAARDLLLPRLMSGDLTV